LINETILYNELLYRRFQKGKKKQPDYIVVFRKNGIIKNMDEAIRVSEQWTDESGNKMPIVIVDLDRYREKNCEKKEQKIPQNENVNENNESSEIEKIKDIHKHFLHFKKEDERE